MKKYPWLMLDLETLSLRPAAVILAIGAVPFDLEEVYHSPIRIVLDASQQKNRHMDPGTVMWWMQQSEQARSVFHTKKKVAVGLGLQQLNDYCNAMMVPIDERGVWGNGSDFDNVLLSNLYEWQGAHGRIERPWRYHGARCFRTLKNICGADYNVISKQVERKNFHDAADDARWQAEVARRLLKRLETARTVAGKATEFCINGTLAIDDLSYWQREYNNA